MKPKKYFDRKNFTHEGGGVYFLFNRKKIVYIGQSLNIHLRLFGHAKKKWTHFRVIESSDRIQIKKWEAILIKRFRPEYNKQMPNVNTAKLSFQIDDDLKSALKKSAKSKNMSAFIRDSLEKILKFKEKELV